FRLGDPPHARFRTVRPGDDAANVVVVDRNCGLGVRRTRYPDQRRHRERRRRAQQEPSRHGHCAPPGHCAAPVFLIARPAGPLIRAPGPVARALACSLTGSAVEIHASRHSIFSRLPRAAARARSARAESEPALGSLFRACSCWRTGAQPRIKSGAGCRRNMRYRCGITTGFGMALLRLTFASCRYDRMEALRTGDVKAEGIDLDMIVFESGREIFDRMVGRREFDLAELSSSEFISLMGRGDCPFVGLPVFPARIFRHGYIFVNTRAGIRAPKDLKGRRVGVPLYTQTAAIWVRGHLAHEFGVDLDTIRWVQG